MQVSEAVCKTWGSVIDVVGKHRLRSKDGSVEEVGTNDKRVFIQLNGPPSGYKGTLRFLKAALTLDVWFCLFFPLQKSYKK